MGETEIAARLITLTEKVEDLVIKRSKIVKMIDEVQEICDLKKYLNE